MDNKKYEELINLVINENEEKARELFHEIVVEKSREIFESIMAEEEEEELEEGMGGQVGDLLDEINAEESGVAEDEEGDIDISAMGDGGDESGLEVTDIEAGDDAAVDGEAAAIEDIQDTVIRIDSKIETLMAEFEAMMGGGEGAEAGIEGGDEFGGDEVSAELSAGPGGEEEEVSLAEAVQLKKVSVTHGDDGAQKKSPVAANSGKTGMDSKPVKFSGEGAEKGRSAPTTKDLPGAGKFKNSPGQSGQDLEKAPAPKKSGGEGTNNKSPVAK